MNRLLPLLLVSALTAASASCGALDPDPLPPQGQIVLGVATDAWLPRSPGQAFEPIPRNALFERMRIELFAPGEAQPCRDCVRDFGLDQRTMNDGLATFGFVPKAGVEGYRARIRIFHAGASESSAEPREAATLEAVVALPAVAGEGIVPVHVVLRTDDLSKPRGTLEAPITVDAGPPPKGLAGTWRQEVVRDCVEPAGEDEACVPGGAFWMGDPALAIPFERLVAVSPFYIDTHEVTTGAVRASGLASLDVAAAKADPYIYSADASKTIHYCTYTQNAGTKEDMPVNCVTRELAQRFCEKRGASLPSEAQFEFVAGARRDAIFPWGEAEPLCDDAIFARSNEDGPPAELRRCASSGVGAAKPGSGKLDRVTMPDGKEIVDLAGNLAEWVLDTYQQTSESCYRDNAVVDPVCREASAILSDATSVRGNSWADLGGAQLRAVVKSRTTTAQTPKIGFRCARPGQ
jgi:sulfatase modifying factor 1